MSTQTPPTVPLSSSSKRPLSHLPTNLTTHETLHSSQAEGYEGDRLHDLFTSTGGGSTCITPTRAQPTVVSAPTSELVTGNNSTITSTTTDFRPFFTVIDTTNANTGEQEQSHPHVHYVFSDDDPDVLTMGVLASLASGNGGAEVGDGADAEDVVSERRVLVTLAEDGRTIVSAQSLTSDWLVEGCRVTAAPTFGGATSGNDATTANTTNTANAGDGKGLMLRIEGVEVSAAHVAVEKQGGQERIDSHEEDYESVEDMIRGVEELAKDYRRELDGLRRLSGLSGRPEG